MDEGVRSTCSGDVPPFHCLRTFRMVMEQHGQCSIMVGAASSWFPSEVVSVSAAFNQSRKVEFDSAARGSLLHLINSTSLYSSLVGLCLKLHFLAYLSTDGVFVREDAKFAFYHTKGIHALGARLVCVLFFGQAGRPRDR